MDTTKRDFTESLLKSDSPALLILALAFGLRIWRAHGTFLNPDEAMHFLFANQTSLAAAYRSSFSLFHPPLLQLLLYFWRHLGTSEFVLRVPSVLAGTAFCWLVFRWLQQILGRTAGWIGLIFVSFLPPMIALSAEVRQYALLLAFAAGAAFFLEEALASQSSVKMLGSSAFLWLALLTHYSAFLFAAAMGCYALVRIAQERPRNRVVISWLIGQIIAVGICAFLYVTHLSRLGAEVAASRGTQAFSSWYLPNSYFHRGENPMAFAVARSFGVFQFLFGQNAVGDVAFLAFAVAVVLLLLRKKLPEQRISSRQLALLLVLPFAINCGAAMARAYPYGGTRHSVFLAMFAVAGVSFSVAWFTKQKPDRALGIALLIAGVCGLFGAPRRPYMLRRDQARANMIEAIDTIHRRVAPGGRIFVDYQTNFLLRYYLCPEVDPARIPFVGGIKTYDCSGYKVTMTSAEINIFTATIFLDEWRELIRQEALKPTDSVWMVQAGWDIGLAQELAKLHEFKNLNAQSFGRNITIFELHAGQPMPTAGFIAPPAPAGPRRGA
ncbi:MAG TPA: glycosyltransferase family 39 protein [Terriglobales bacterium]|nr:glycosyltransferase family 39 protein [Terriglobales bacterium]